MERFICDMPLLKVGITRASADCSVAAGSSFKPSKVITSYSLSLLSGAELSSFGGSGSVNAADKRLRLLVCVHVCDKAG